MPGRILPTWKEDLQKCQELHCCLAQTFRKCVQAPCEKQPQIITATAVFAFQKVTNSLQFVTF